MKVAGIIDFFLLELQKGSKISPQSLCNFYSMALHSSVLGNSECWLLDRLNLILLCYIGEGRYTRYEC